MLFNSYEFIFVFFPIVLFGYYLFSAFKNDKLSKGWLVLASLYFYSYLNPKYLPIILASIIINYLVGHLLHLQDKNTIQRKVFLSIGISFNIGILGYFKYYDFFLENINIALGTNLALLNLALPLGISFFTFQQLSFLIDNYRRKTLKYDFLSYSLFVTFFPQLIAGPIVLPSEMLPQFEAKENKALNYNNLSKGLFIFAIGLAKKVVIADSVAAFADAGFDKLTTLTFFEGWLTSLSYTIQLYFDFSGYCDMAMGIALMFNIVLPKNFNSPYKSKDIQEFWKRWHMTLSRFLTNYLYIPLGGNRRGTVRTYINLWIVFLVSGIWHGAGWTFIIWGIFHGLAIVIHRIWKGTGRQLNKYLAWFLTFNIVNIFWIFFRAKDLKTSMHVLKSMFDFKSIPYLISENYFKVADSYLDEEITIAILFLALIGSLFLKNGYERLEHFKYRKINRIEIIFYLFGSLLLLNRIAEFLYFNF